MTILNIQNSLWRTSLIIVVERNKKVIKQCFYRVDMSGSWMFGESSMSGNERTSPRAIVTASIIHSLWPSVRPSVCNVMCSGSEQMVILVILCCGINGFPLIFNWKHARDSYYLRSRDKWKIVVFIFRKINYFLYFV